MLDFHRISKGLEIDRASRVLRGTIAPGSTTDTNTAQVGSLYLNNTTGNLYLKQTSGTGTDKWQITATQQYVTNAIASLSYREPVEVADVVSVTLPTGSPGNPIVIDGESIIDTQRVLFTMVSPANIYIYDQATATFSEDSNIATINDVTFVKRGTYKNRRFVYTDTGWLTYDAIYMNNIVVQKDPGVDQFGTIQDALVYAASQSPSPSSQWNIVVYPGTYVEPPLQVPDYTHLTAAAPQTVDITPTSPSNDIITLGTFSGLHGFSIGAASTGRAVVIKDVVVEISQLLFQDNQVDVYIEGDAAPTVVRLHDIISISGGSLAHGIQIVATGGQETSVGIDSVIYNVPDAASVIDVLSVTGTGADVVYGNVTVVGAEVGYGLTVSDGARAASSGLIIRDVGVGLYVPSGGAAPQIYLQAQIVQDDLPNIQIDHTGTLGFYAGAADHDEVTIAPGATQLSLAYSGTDATEPGDVGFCVVGSLLLGSEQANTTDVTDLIQQASPTGSLSGGVITSTGGLNVSIASGYGYLVDPITLREKRVVWTTTPLALADDTSTNYIYVDDTGTVTFASSPPDIAETILLGRVRTTGGSVVLIAAIPIIATQSATFIDNYLRNAIGSIYGTGSLVTENVTPLQVDVTSGTYYYSKTTFNPSGGTAITFGRFFHTGGVQDFDVSTIVDNTQYDNGTDLTALTATYYTKHTLYLAGDGSNEGYALVYGQAEYATLVDAQTAPLPTPPSFLTLDINVPIAAMIVQEGNPNIVQIIDIRPRLGFQAPSTAGVTNHGDLTGLLADDHPQYLLVSGTRAMTGDLDMGTNDITNVGTVNGVMVQAHGLRHGANSADPTPTAAPITNHTPTTVNAAGVADTLARSDHTHGMTGFQPLDSDLTALASIGTTGLYTITGVGTSTTRSLVQPAAGITISNADGVAGNPTFALANDLNALENLAGTGIGVRTAANTWAQRSLTQPAAGITISNNDGVGGNPTFALANDLNALENLGGTGIAVRSAADTWVQRSLVQPAAGITISNADGAAGNPTFALANDLLALENLAGTGFAVRSAADTWVQRTITGTAGRITVSNGSGIAANPQIDIDTTFMGPGGFIQRFTFQADQMDSPGTANWAVNARAPASADTVNAALVVRRFDDTTEEGVGGAFTIPTGAVNVVIYFKSRAQTAPGGTVAVQPTLYHRVVPDNAAVGAWSAALNLTTISIPTNTNFQYDSQTITLASLGWTAGEFRQWELTRRGTQVGDTLTGDWDLLEMIWEFTT